MLSRRCAFLLFAVFTLATTSQGQLTKTATSGTHEGPCGVSHEETIYSNWVYTDSFGAHEFTGSTDVIFAAELPPVDGKRESCPGGTTTLDVNSTDNAGYHLHAVGAAGTISMYGYLNPKYLIMGVTYAPPGGNTSSFVSYANTDFVGNTTTNSHSFMSNFTLTVSVCGATGTASCGGGGSAGSVVGALLGFGGGVAVTGSETTSWTQASNNSSSITISKQTSVANKTPGVPNVFSPVNHDYDIIWIWVNPVVLFTIPSTNTSTSGTIYWNGYGYDYADPLHEVDVWPVLVGSLNGHFGTSFNCNGVIEPIDCQDAGVLARGWVKTQTFPSGQSAAITSADYPAILAADPFAQNPGYLVTLASGISPATTTDGRFTQSETNNTAPETIPYKQAGPDSTSGANEMFTEQYSNSTTLGQSATSTFSQEFGVEEKTAGTFFWQSVEFDFKETSTLTWMNSWQNTVTNTSTQTNTLSITGPPCPAPVEPCNPQYTEPHEFATYQDNLYGTFMFWPNPFFSISAVTPQSQTVVAGGRASYTITTAANAGYTGNLTSFNVTGLPSGATPSFSPSTGAAGITSTLTVSTTSATPAGTYPLTISTGDGTLSYFASTTLVVGSAPGFSITVSPSSHTIGIGGVTTYTVTIAATNGFAGVVNLGVDGLASNSSASFSPETITGSGTSTLTITTTASIAPGTYTLTFTGTSGSLSETTTGMLVVTGANFTLSATPEIQAINAGSSAAYTVSTSVVSGFDAGVALSVSGLPSGASATFSPASITGAGSSTLTITTTSATAAGDYNLTITGTSGSGSQTLTQTAPITIEVND